MGRLRYVMPHALCYHTHTAKGFSGLPVADYLTQ